MRRLARFIAFYLVPAWCWLALSASPVAALSGEGPEGEQAPMCDPNGASVAARDEIPEVDHGRFEALPCEAQLVLSGWQLDAPELGRRAVSIGNGQPRLPVQHAEPPHARQDGARELGIPFPRCPEPVLTELGQLEGLAPSPGHAPGLFRPPVAGARVAHAARV